MGATAVDSGRTKVSPGRAPTGIPGLDEVLRGGFPLNHLYLVEGDPGTGKTTLALQFLLEGVRAGEPVLYVTLSESKAELEEIACSHGWSVDGVPVFELTPDEEDLNAEAQYTVFHPSDVELADTINSVLKRVHEMQPRRVVFDSLSELRLLARDPLRYRRQILALKQFFFGKECTVLLLDDRTTTGHDLQLQSIAHGVLILQSLERAYGGRRRQLEVRKLRGSRYREGFHDFSIETGGLVVYPRLVAAEHPGSFEPLPVLSGFAELDELLGGGVTKGTSTLLMGPAGCGKSTVAARYVLSAAQRGEFAVIFTFDERIATLIERTNGLGMSLEPHLRSGKIRLHQIDPTEISPGEFVSQVRNYVEEHHASVVVIDSMNGFLNAMPDEQFLLLQLHELLSYLGLHGVATILTLAQHGVMGTGVESPVDLSYLADAVVLFRYFEFQGEIKQALSIVKKRSGPHERSIRELIFSGGTVRVGPALTQFEGVLTGVPRFRGSARDMETRATTERE
jgi:circadian clock protein KaiC